MMSGELEFEDIFYGDVPVKYPVTAHIMFLSFVLLVTVILTNLMVGLAVSDIQGLQVSASLDRLVRQAELVSRYESLFFSRLLRRAPKNLLRLCKRSALLRTSRNKLLFTFRPNDPRDEKLPEEIKLNVYKLVAERCDRNQSMKQNKFESNYNFFNKSLMKNESECISCTKKQNCSNRENDALLRPRSATNVPHQQFEKAETFASLKSQASVIADIHEELKIIKAHVSEVTKRMDKFTEVVVKKLNVTTEDLCRIKMNLEQKIPSFY